MLARAVIGVLYKSSLLNEYILKHYFYNTLWDYDDVNINEGLFYIAMLICWGTEIVWQKPCHWQSSAQQRKYTLRDECDMFCWLDIAQH